MHSQESSLHKDPSLLILGALYIIQAQQNEFSRSWVNGGDQMEFALSGAMAGDFFASHQFTAREVQMEVIER